MALSPTEIVEELNERLRRSGKPVITMTWPEFYEMADRARFKAAGLDQITAEALSRYQLIFGQGHTAVVICHDRNFQPSP